MKRFGFLFVLIALLVLVFAMPVTAQTEASAIYFKDVPSGAWYYDYVYSLVDAGVISGYEDGTFRPDNNISRAEIATILARMSGDNYKLYVNDNHFTDCRDHWARAYINWAYSNGIVNGVGNGKFDPNAPITREALCTMVMRYAKYTSFYPVKNGSPVNFADDNDISSWARDSVYHMQQAGIINGKGNGDFEPQSKATRGECAKIFDVFRKCNNDLTSKFLIEDFDWCHNYFGSVSSYYLADYTHDGYEDLIIVEPLDYGAAIYVYSSLGGDLICVYQDEVYPIAYDESYYLYFDASGAYLMHYTLDTATGMTIQEVSLFHGNWNGDKIYDYYGATEFFIDGSPYDTGVPQKFYMDQRAYSEYKAKSTLLFRCDDQTMIYNGQSYEDAVSNWGKW
ncbi:MAG: S-layer homology domain-containing protein [Firmicutes bacterium]|nr:S-layer homology domain-containing protein [Bacillota bacterium]